MNKKYCQVLIILYIEYICILSLTICESHNRTPHTQYER